MIREYNSNVVNAQERIRTLLLKGFYAFDISKVDSIVASEKAIKSELDKIVEATEESSDEDFFKYYGYLISAFFHLLKWVQKELLATNSNHLKTSITYIEQINFEYFSYIPDFRDEIKTICEAIKQVKTVNDVKEIFQAFTEIPFPIIVTFSRNLGQKSHGVTDSHETLDKGQEIILLSLQFTIGGEPWANPQILKPEEIYIIKGKILINVWPEDFDVLILKPASTSSNEWFNLSIPEIQRESKKEYNISGHIVFKYPQSTFDELISIRLIGFFKNKNSGVTVFPTIIGYDQLILKVLDPNSSYFVTGFKSINKIVLDIQTTISKELPNLDNTEKENFLLLLSGILNYQGFCLQQGIFKGRDKVVEDTFRDKMIQHLIGIPYLGEEIIKEAHLAGGRVEIGFRGFIAELKVEYKISDRKKLIEKYSKQPVAYASGNSKQLSILCILDLTEKNNPPAVSQNNIQLLSPAVHGFESDQMNNPSKVVMIVIDGNTKSPSEYSR